MLEIIRKYAQTRLDDGKELRLHFICTHNSRRSQLSQVWGQLAAGYYGIPATCYSGGVEVTSCNERTIASLRRSGFEVRQEGGVNPFYYITYSEEALPVVCFSKKYDDPLNPSEGFAAIMTSITQMSTALLYRVPTEDFRCDTKTPRLMMIRKRRLSAMICARSR